MRDRNPSSRGGVARLTLLGTVAVFLLGAAAWRPALPSSGDPLVVLALGALTLELAAVPLPGFGFFSPAFGCYLAAGLTPSVGWMGAVALLVLGVLARSLRGGSRDPRWKAREAVADLLPAAAGLALARWLSDPAVGGWGLGAGLGAAAYLFAAIIVPSLLSADLGPEEARSWAAAHQRLTPLFLGVACSGPLLATLVGHQIWLGLVFLPVLWAVARGAALSFEGPKAEKLHLAHQLSRTRQSLVQTSRGREQTRLDLEARTEDYHFLQDLTASCSFAPEVEEVQRQVILAARLRVPSHSVVLWLADEKGCLFPAGVQTAHSEEPVGTLIQSAWLSGQPVQPGAEAHSGRVFPDEPTAVAVPAPGVGVLYVGTREAGGYSPEQVRRLSELASQGLLALRSAYHYEARQRATAHLEEVLRLVGLSLEAIRELVALGDPDPVLDKAGKWLQRIVPHQLRIVMAGDRPGVRIRDCQRVHSARPYPVDQGLLEAIGDQVLQTGRPLLLEAEARRRPLAPGIESVLALPLLTDEGPVGVAVLGSEQAAFSREHRDLGLVLGYQLGAVYGNALLHARLRTALEQLRQSQAQLIQSSKLAAVGQLAAGVAHELNTPAGAVLMGLDLALSALPEGLDRVARRLSRARVGAEAIRDIVAKLLSYARPGPRHSSSVDLHRVVKDALALVGHRLELDQIQLELELSPVPAIWANPQEIQQVLINLVNNAGDAVLTPGARERRIRVRTFTEGDSAVLEVEDHGPGMPPEVQERIFDPFFTTKAVGSGTGLGLSVSLELVKQHGGSLRAASELGQGSRFQVSLPRSQEARTEDVAEGPG